MVLGPGLRVSDLGFMGLVLGLVFRENFRFWVQGFGRIRGARVGEGRVIPRPGALAQIQLSMRAKLRLYAGVLLPLQASLVRIQGVLRGLEEPEERELAEDERSHGQGRLRGQEHICPTRMAEFRVYRGTSLIRNNPPSGPYSRSKPRAAPRPASAKGRTTANMAHIDSCITQLKAQGPSRTFNESKEEERRQRIWHK